MSKLKDWAVAGAVLLIGRRREADDAEEPPIVAAGPTSRRAETVLLLLFGLASLCSIGFVVVYAVDGIPHQTQLLGLTLGAALVLLAAACIVIGSRLVVTERLADDYPELEHLEEQEQVAAIVAQSGSRFTRRRLVVAAGAGAAGALGLAAIAPALSLGPALDPSVLDETPWRRGRRLVGEDGRPLAKAAIEQEAFYTAYPEGADRELIGSPLVVVRLPIEQIVARRDWAPGGIVAYSKICTHAGCAVALYRKPRFPAVEPAPALVCPCHYSTFDPADAGKVIYGPAGRNLPQLPLLVDRAGNLRAAGNFSGPVGPSWWGVRMGRARS